MSANSIAIGGCLLSFGREPFARDRRVCLNDFKIPVVQHAFRVGVRGFDRPFDALDYPKGVGLCNCPSVPFGLQCEANFNF